jgi:hypothetical protein
MPAEIIPGTVDCELAVLTAPDSDGNGNTPPSLPTDVVDNNASETMTASLSADGLTLTLTTKPYTAALDPGDLGTNVVYGGVFLRPLSPALQANSYHIGSATPNASASCALAAGAATLNNVSNVAISSTVNIY